LGKNALFLCTLSHWGTDAIISEYDYIIRIGEQGFMDAMTKMWVSLIGIGLMAIAAFLITFARYKTKGIIKFVLSLIAFICLIVGFFLGVISII